MHPIFRFSRFLALLAWGFSHSPFADANSLPRAPVLFYVGEQRVMTIPGLLHYSQGANRAFQVLRLGPNQLLLRAQAPIRTTLTLQIQIKSGETPKIHEVPIWIDPIPASVSVPGLHLALQELGQIQHLQAIAVGGEFVLRGEIQTREESEHLMRALLAAPPPSLHPEITLTPALLTEACAQIQAALPALALAQTAVSLECLIQNGVPVLRGSFLSLQDQKLARTVLQRAFPYWEDQTQVHHSSTRTAHFRAYLLEIERTRALQLGVHFSPNTNGTLQVTPLSGIQLTPWELRLEHLQREGELQILSAPEIVVLTPGEGEFFSGGEIPLRTHNRFVSQIQWKPYGLSLKIKTQSAEFGQIRFEIQTEASHLDGANAMDGVPALKTNRLKTEVEANFGEPLLLTGLTQNHQEEAHEGIPLLSTLPGIGFLFGAKDARETARDLVVSVIAHVAPPPAPVERIRRLLPRGPIPLRWLTPPERKVQLEEIMP